jgi:hypothetical protein
VEEWRSVLPPVIKTLPLIDNKDPAAFEEVNVKEGARRVAWCIARPVDISAVSSNNLYLNTGTLTDPFCSVVDVKGPKISALLIPAPEASIPPVISPKWKARNV